MMMNLLIILIEVIGLLVSISYTYAFFNSSSSFNNSFNSKNYYFTLNGNTYREVIVNNECPIPSEVLVEKGQVEIQAIGAGALNQAIKAIAIARGFVAPSGKNLICIPAFSDILIDGEERTAIKLIVEAK